MTANELKLFEAGEKITADETNDNNRYLLGVAQDTSGELQNYVDTQLESFQTSLNTQISSINTQISNVSNVANSKISATESKSSNGYCKLSNGIIIQWGNVSGMGKGTSKTVTLPTAFTTGNYSVAGSDDYDQTAGDKGSTWRTYNYSTSSFKIQSRFEQSSGHIIWWVAIGY